MLQHSYEKDDVQVLLHPINPVFLSVEEKEIAIQAGTHYSEILSREKQPDQAYLALFDEQVVNFGLPLAGQLLDLAGMIAASRSNPVLVSLVRGGTPVGVVLKRILNRFGVPAPHFAVSIVRDRGLDLVAIEHILALGHAPEDLVFIDGWTGKGVIRRELSASVKAMQATYPGIRDELFVLSDIAGVADYAATRLDSLLPTCLLNAPISGLISRSVYRQQDGIPLMHGGVYLEDLAPADRSVAFVEHMMSLIEHLLGSSTASLRFIGLAALDKVRAPAVVAEEMHQLLRTISHLENVTDRNKIKPGLGEASRVLLRRMPEALIVRDSSEPAVAHLLMLAKEREVRVRVLPEMKIQAVAIIKELNNE
jgi:hypothetical protein